MVLRLGNIVTLLGLASLVFSAQADPIGKRSTLVQCLKAASVPVIESTSAAYPAEVLPYNLRTPFFPQAVAVPETATHISSALICAQHFNVKVAARSGGHSYAGFGLGGKNGSLMIDMKTFKSIDLDTNTGVATVGVGNRLGDVAYALFNLGGRALPHGLCPTVGLGGHALHGGYGMTSRMWGITLDTIIEIEVVLANGTITTASKTKNEDLFWALRGAGESFGVATKFKFQTLEAPANGVEFTYVFGDHDPATGSKIPYQVSVFEALQEYAQNTAPKEIGLRWFTFQDGFNVTGVYWGSREDFNVVIAPLLAKFPPPLATVIQEYGWLDMLISLANGDPIPVPANYTTHSTFFTKSLIAPEPLTSDALTSFLTYLQNGRNASVYWYVIADVYGGVHSNISSFSLDSASYAGRDSLFTFQLYSVPLTIEPPYPAAGFDFMNRMVESITDAQPQTNFAAYPNYVDPSLSASEAHKLYFGSQYPRLLKIKRAVDPKMTLWNPQAIGVV